MSKEATSMKWARRWLASSYPGCPVQEAQASVVWTPTGPISRPEDLYGCFDLMTLTPAGDTVLVQVTTWKEGSGAASTRRTKVRRWIADHFDDVHSHVATIYVVAWEARTALHLWRWGWTLHRWQRLPQVPGRSLRADQRGFAAPPRVPSLPAPPPEIPESAIAAFLSPAVG
jgi:hypothetical protein